MMVLYGIALILIAIYSLWLLEEASQRLHAVDAVLGYIGIVAIFSIGVVAITKDLIGAIS